MLRSPSQIVWGNRFVIYFQKFLYSRNPKLLNKSHVLWMFVIGLIRLLGLKLHGYAVVEPILFIGLTITM